jgi:hypothetical protein
MNITEAIHNISNLESWNIKENFKSENRINRVGDSLEEFVKNSFLNFQNDLELESQIFSWLGNSNNPPDLILRNGDAIEVKKMNSYSQVALNSSFPKNRITSSDQMLTKSCREIDGGNWTKNLYYFIGKMDKNRIESLFIVDGSLYSADSKIYENLKNRVRETLGSASNTKELGRLNKIDPLGITYLRIRGMWGIENPFDIFSYLEIEKPKSGSVLYALISKENFESEIEADEVKVRNPNNPAELLDAYLVKVFK